MNLELVMQWFDLGRTVESERAGSERKGVLRHVINTPNGLAWGADEEPMQAKLRVYCSKPIEKKPKYVRHEVSIDGYGEYLRAARIRLDMWACRPDCAGYEFAEWPDIICSSPMRYVDGNGGAAYEAATVSDLQSGIRKLANLVAVWQRAKD